VVVVSVTVSGGTESSQDLIENIFISVLKMNKSLERHECQ